MMTTYGSARSWVGALLLAAAGGTQAAEHGPLIDRFYLGLGAFAFSADTKLRIDGDGTRGTSIDWERDLGLDEADSFRVDAFWRFAERHKLRAMYFNNKRDGRVVLDRDVTVHGDLYPLDAVVETFMDTRIIELAYEYAFLKREHYEIAATAGVHLTRVEPGIEITGSVGGTDVEVGQSAAVKAEMPLPVFGVRGMWHLGRDIYLDAHVQYFYLSIDQSDGSITDLRAAVSWNPRNWFGVGVGYNEFDTNLDVDVDSFEGKLDWTYRGPQVFFVATF